MDVDDPHYDPPDDSTMRMQDDDDDDPNNNDTNTIVHDQLHHHHQQQQQQQTHTRSRRRSSTGAESTTTSVSSVVGNGHMTETEQEERRRQIRTIMLNQGMSQQEKSRSIQSLMDGRARRCSLNSTGGQSFVSVGTTPSTAHSYVSNMSRAAAAASEYYNSDYSNNIHNHHNHNNDITTTATIASAMGDDVPHQQQQQQQPPPSHQRCILDLHQYRDDRSVASSVSSGSTAYHYYATTSSDESPPRPPLAPPTHIPYRQYHGRSQSLQDWTETDRVTAAPNTTVCNPAGVSRLMEQSRPECTHYVRNCTIVSPCCGLAFGCRICHDDCPVLPPPMLLSTQRRGSLSTAAPAPHHTSSRVERRRSMPVDFSLEHIEHEETHHLIDRFAIKEVICRCCYLRQSSKTNNCIRCGVQFGEYHCIICNLWMTDKDGPYHCHDCGFCRVGGRDNFRHCHDCGMCIDINLFDDHNCKSGKYMSNCPVCQEDLFSSRFASHEMPCGHAIHWHCFQELISYDTRCPVCKKTAESPEDMAATWSTLAMGIACQPVPPDLARVVNIICIDCEQTSTNRRWHFLGVRCNHCLSFNTCVEQFVLQGRAAAEYLENRERNATVPTDITMLNMRPDNDDSMDDDDDDSSNEDDLG